MSLPSGLLFYLDYTYGTDVGGENGAETYASGESIYNQPTGKGIQSGSLGIGGQYDLLGSGYSRRHILADDVNLGAPARNVAGIVSMTAAGVAAATGSEAWSAGDNYHTELTGAIGRLVDFDSEIARAIADGDIGGIAFLLVPVKSGTGMSIAGSSETLVSQIAKASGEGSALPIDLTMLQDITCAGGDTGVDFLTTVPASLQAGGSLLNFRRHNKLVKLNSSGKVTVDPIGGNHLLMTVIPVTGAPIDYSGGHDV
jgi:hypothetical protein